MWTTATKICMSRDAVADPFFFFGFACAGLIAVNQRGQVVTDTAESCQLDIHREVTQGCVLSLGYPVRCWNRLSISGRRV